MTPADSATKADRVRALLSGARSGVLSTHALDPAGYPYGTVVPYALDGEGRPLVLVSALAQHSRNLQADPRASLAVADSAGASEAASTARLTYVCEAVRETDRARAAASYYARFPEARAYGESLDFTFVRLDPVKVRYVGGFGDMFWLDGKEYR